MNFEFSAHEQRFIEEVRGFLKEEAELPDASDVMNPSREADSQLADSPARRAFMKRLADRGYLGMSWPKKYGGQERDGVYEYLLNEELASVGAPLIGKGVGCIGKTLIRHGSEKLKLEFLPQILSGDIEFALGYTEPSAGSDLASLKLKATREDNGWRINGQKAFNTSAHFADWYWVAARTDPEAPKHKGISVFLIDMKDPGLTVHPIETMGGHRTNQVFFDDVYVSDDYLVGDINKGWIYICEALDYERFTLYTVGPLTKKLELLTQMVQEETRDGAPVSADKTVRRKLARLATDVETAVMLQRRVIMGALDGDVPSNEAAMFKLYSTQLGQRMADTAMDILGAESVLATGAPGAPAGGRWELSHRATVVDTIGGGTSEVQRNIIARRKLGLPSR